MNKKWYPNSVSYLRELFIIKESYINISNLCYTIQYLEYLNHIIKDNNNHSVIQSYLIKDYIIYSFSVIEDILLLVIKNKYIKNKYNFYQLLNFVMKYKLIKIDYNTFNKIIYLKKLRNKIHIYNNDKTNYNDFKYEYFLDMRNILLIFLFDDNVSDNSKRKYLLL